MNWLRYPFYFYFFYRCVLSMVNKSLCSVFSKAYIIFIPLTQELTASE